MSFHTSFYTAAPISLGVSCAPEALTYARNQILELILNGKEQMPDIQIDWVLVFKPFIYLEWQQWIGAIIFFWGWLHQYYCHAILVRSTSIINLTNIFCLVNQVANDNLLL